MELPDRVVQLWTVRLLVSEEALARLYPLLTKDEKSRAKGFSFLHLQQSFVLTRGVLRMLLGSYADMAPHAVPLAYGPCGKPTIAIPNHIDFNLSHSGTLAVFAFTNGLEIGIDLEQIRPFSDIQDLASRFFCADEVIELQNVPPPDRERAFFLCWTRKEAYLKAIGDGLATPLDGFAVALKPDDPARLLHVGYDPKAAEAWTLHNLELSPGYAGALAYRGAPRPVHVFPLLDVDHLLTALTGFQHGASE
ncbi:4'-phosphopantetheinyl transferase superfamily protein [uncultured Paludibaculum sp.]|uniref:4'-phosphopantetheinyl transferase family protein n=1 Tax=uncultured Paludibaculum sp. TaxID=1765020 RepID=UPI002AAB22E0|nr:4'-phosphopantetheinyl transferase superfamily protein [uncultured Paludibaculum sp.]